MTVTSHSKRPLHRQLYLICSTDSLETAYYCGTAEECSRVLGCSSINTFRSTIAHGYRFMSFFKVEKVGKTTDLDI